MIVTRNNRPLPALLGFTAPPSIVRVPIEPIAVTFGFAIVVLITVILGAIS